MKKNSNEQYTILHTTEYKYYEPVALCHNIAKLLPRNTDTQSCKKSKIEIFPAPDVIEEYYDFFGNRVIYFAIQQEHKELIVAVRSEIIKKVPVNPEFNWYSYASWEEIKELLEKSSEYLDELQYIPYTPMTIFNEEIEAYARQSFLPGKTVFDASLELTQRIFTDFIFDAGFTTVTTPVLQVFKERKGVCQDFAHLAIACLRSVGLPARYVSGYIETLPPAGTAKLIGVDASHAWFSVFIPGMGWVDFDPTNNVIPAERHITIGWGRDYADICPLKGVILSNGPHKLKVSVDVRRVSEVFF